MDKTLSKMGDSPAIATTAETEPKMDKKKKENNYTAIKCWFCNKTGHTQIECRT